MGLATSPSGTAAGKPKAYEMETRAKSLRLLPSVQEEGTDCVDSADSLSRLLTAQRPYHAAPEDLCDFESSWKW